MGRPIKNGLDYFPLYTDFIENPKIEDLTSKFSAWGTAVYIAILCFVYRNGYYEKFASRESLARYIAKRLSSDRDQLSHTISRTTEVIDYLLETGMLDRSLFEQNILSSRSMQEQYIKCMSSMKRKVQLEEYCLIPLSESTPKNGVNAEETAISTEETAINSEESTQRKEKETKGNIHSFNLSRESDDEEEFSTSQRKRLGKIGKGVVMLSDEQIEELLSEMSLDEFDYYCGVVADCELSGKSFKKKTHFQAIRDMARKDRKIK